MKNGQIMFAVWVGIFGHNMLDGFQQVMYCLLICNNLRPEGILDGHSTT